MKSRRCRREKGFAIVTVLFVIGILLVMATALSLTAISNSQLALNTGAHQQAYLVGESAITDVVTQLGNGTITPSALGPTTGGPIALRAGSGTGAYTYSVTFNTNPNAPIIVQNPFYSSWACTANVDDPGPGCVTVPRAVPGPPVRPTAFIYVSATYNGRTVRAEAMGLGNDITSNGATVFINGNGPFNNQVGGASINSDPNDPNGTLHDVIIQSNSNWTVGGPSTVDGVVNVAGSVDQAAAPAGCTAPLCEGNTSQPPWPFPSNNLSQGQAFWKAAARANDCYYTSPPSTLTVQAGKTCFIDGGQTLDLKNVKIQNAGGLLVVVGPIQETGNQSNSNYELTPACATSCACKQQAHLVDLSTAGVAMHGVGTGAASAVSQGLILTPNGTFQNVGNNAFYAAVIAKTARFGGSGGIFADVCAAQGVVGSPGFSIAAYGLDDQ